MGDGAISAPYYARAAAVSASGETVNCSSCVVLAVLLASMTLGAGDLGNEAPVRAPPARESVSADHDGAHLTARPAGRTSVGVETSGYGPLAARRGLPHARTAATPTLRLTPTRALRLWALGLAADGPRVAFFNGGARVWNVQTGRLERFVYDEEYGGEGPVVGGRRLAWIEEYGGKLLRASHALDGDLGRARRAQGANGELQARGRTARNLAGDGRLIAWNHDFWGRKPTLWKLTGVQKPPRVRIGAGRDVHPVVAVHSGRIVTQPRGRIVLLDGNGRRIAVVRPNARVRDVQLHGRRLAFVSRAHVHVYDATRNVLIRRWPLRVRRASVSVTRLRDLEGDLAVYFVGRVLHLLRLSDGRDRVVDMGGRIRDAQLEAGGLFVAFQKVPGGARIAFVPLKQVAARFG
jgi:hypothetical protein